MPVYKLCMKITRKNIPNLLIYIIVFLIVSSIMAASAQKSAKKIWKLFFAESRLYYFLCFEERKVLWQEDLGMSLGRQRAGGHQ